MRNPSKRAKHNKVTVSLTCDWQNMRGGDKGHVIKEEREGIEMKWVGFEGWKEGYEYMEKRERANSKKGRIVKEDGRKEGKGREGG